MNGVGFVVFHPVIEDMVVELHKSAAVGHCDLIQIPDQPADILKAPFVGQADKAVIGGDVGEEGELPAANSTSGPVAVGRALALEQ